MRTDMEVNFCMRSRRELHFLHTYSVYFLQAALQAWINSLTCPLILQNFCILFRMGKEKLSNIIRQGVTCTAAEQSKITCLHLCAQPCSFDTPDCSSKTWEVFPWRWPCLAQDLYLHGPDRPSSSLRTQGCKNPVHWKYFYNVLAMFKLQYGQFTSMRGEERDCKLLYLGNKPFCLHFLILQTKDFRGNLGAVADFSQQLVRRQLGEESCFFFFFLKGGFSGSMD